MLPHRPTRSAATPPAVAPTPRPHRAEPLRLAEIDREFTRGGQLGAPVGLCIAIDCVVGVAAAARRRGVERRAARGFAAGGAPSAAPVSKGTKAKCTPLSPSGRARSDEFPPTPVVTETAALPASAGGVVQRTSRDEMKRREVQRHAPISDTKLIDLRSPLSRPSALPWTVTRVPPARGPDAGTTDDSRGGSGTESFATFEAIDRFAAPDQGRGDADDDTDVDRAAGGAVAPARLASCSRSRRSRPR